MNSSKALLVNDRMSETVVFDIFRQGYNLTGTFIHNEGNRAGDENKPDFIRQDGDLGIEITEINMPGKIHGKTLRQHEAVKQRIIDRACQKAIQSSLPPLRVCVIFADDLAKDREAPLTEDLFQIVKCHCPGPSSSQVELKKKDGLPHEFWMVSIQNYGDLLKEHYWDYIEVGTVETHFSDQLQETMDVKSRKVSKYLQYCGTCWLVIASLGYRPPSFYVLSDQVKTANYRSDFEKVFFVDAARRTVTELHLARA